MTYISSIFHTPPIRESNRESAKRKRMQEKQELEDLATKRDEIVKYNVNMRAENARLSELIQSHLLVQVQISQAINNIVQQQRSEQQQRSQQDQAVQLLSTLVGQLRDNSSSSNQNNGAAQAQLPAAQPTPSPPAPPPFPPAALSAILGLNNNNNPSPSASTQSSDQTQTMLLLLLLSTAMNSNRQTT